MFEFFEKSMMLMGRSMAEAAREQAVSLTASLNDIRSGYQQREAVLTEGVLEAGETVRRASDQVAISGGAIRHEIDRAGSVRQAQGWQDWRVCQYRRVMPCA